MEFFSKNLFVITILVIIFGIYLGLSSASVNDLQMGFGDMHSLYIFKRLSQGVDQFGEINTVYGPIFYLIGSQLTSFGLTYSGLKIFMLLISVFNGILIFLISKRIFKQNNIGVLSTTIYLFMPMHYGFAPMFHPDLIAVFFFLIATYFLLSEKKKHVVISGLFSGISVFTKLVVLPLTIAPIIYFLINKKKNGIIYTITFASILFSVMIYVNSVSPENENLEFFLTRVMENPDLGSTKLLQVVLAEGIVYLVGIIGLGLYLKNIGKKSLLSFITVSSAFSFATIIHMGVGSYVISYSEPFIAILASYFIFYIFEKFKAKKIGISKNIIPTVLILIIFFQFAWFDYPGNERLTDWRGNGWTKNYDDMARIHSELLEKYTEKGDIVFASPMALYKTDRVFPLDDPYSESLLIKQKLGFESASKKLDTLSQMLENQQIKMIISYYPVTYNEVNLYPYYIESFQKILEKNYDIYHEKGVYYYLPKK